MAARTIGQSAEKIVKNLCLPEHFPKGVVGPASPIGRGGFRAPMARVRIAFAREVDKVLN